MKKIFFFIFFLVLAPQLLSANSSNIKKIDKLLDQGIINKNEYLNIKGDIYGVKKSKNKKKNLNLLSKKKYKYKSKGNKEKKLKNLFKGIKFNILNIVFTSEEVNKLGKPKKIEFKDYPLSLQKVLKKEKHSFNAQSQKAGKILFKTFTRGPAYGQRHPGKMIKGMAMYEIFYAQKLYKAKNALERYNNQWSNPKDILLKHKDSADINSLIGMNEGRKNMREALGMSLEMSSEDAIKRFWVLGDFLDLGNPQTLEKHSKEIKKRKKLINDYKVEIAALKKTLVDNEKSNFRKINDK